MKEKKYFKPTSSAWWGGLASILSGVAMMVEKGGFDAQGMAAISLGLSAIGIRAKL